MNLHSIQEEKNKPLDKKYRETAKDVVRRLIEGVKKGCGADLKSWNGNPTGLAYCPRLSVEGEGDGPRIVTVEIEQIVGGSFTRVATGLARVQLDFHRRHSMKRTYRQAEGKPLNVDGIVKVIVERVHEYRRSKQYEKEAAERRAENERAQGEELREVKLPEGMRATRKEDSGLYDVQVMGTFSELTAEQVKEVAERFGELVKGRTFQKDYRLGD